MVCASRIRRWSGPPVLLFIALIPWIGWAADEAPGLGVGQAAPAFSLPDQHGKQLQLANLLKQGKLAIVFYRSADW